MSLIFISLRTQDGEIFVAFKRLYCSDWKFLRFIKSYAGESLYRSRNIWIVARKAEGLGCCENYCKNFLKVWRNILANGCCWLLAAGHWICFLLPSAHYSSNSAVCPGAGRQEEVDFWSYVEARGKDTGKYDLSELLTEVKTLVMSWTISNIVAEISEILWKCR